MRLVALLSVTAVLCAAGFTACRTNKEAQSTATGSVDSVAQSLSNRSFLRIDTALTRLNFDFDTLTIEWTSEIVNREVDIQAPISKPTRLRIVKGKVATTQNQFRQIEDAHTQRDTLAFKRSTAVNSVEHTATTRVYNPPDITTILIIGISLLAIILYLRSRK